MTSTLTSSSAAAAPSRVAVAPVTFARVVRAEWIKFWTLRSTYWSIGVTLALMVFMSTLMAFAASQSAQNPEFGPGPSAAMVIGFGYSMAQLVVAVLGVLTISGEYGTGMIRSSLTAVPTRVPVLLAKALVVGLVSFVLGVVGVALCYLVTAPMLDGVGGPADLSDPAVLQVFWGTGLYLMAIGLLALGIGALLRHSAGAIAAVVAVVWLIPTIVQLLSLWLDLFGNVYPYLPTTAGEQILGMNLDSLGAGDMFGAAPLDPWVGFAVLLGYVVVTLGTAAVLLRRRDA